MQREVIDPRFDFMRCAESLAQRQRTFDPLDEALLAPRNLIDERLYTQSGSAPTEAFPIYAPRDSISTRSLCSLVAGSFGTA